MSSECCSTPKTRTINISRIVEWQRKNRDHVRRKLKDSQDDRVLRNKASRILKESGRAKKCIVCGSTRDLEVSHEDNNPKNFAKSNLQYRCNKHHKTKPKGTPQMKVQK